MHNSGTFPACCEPDDLIVFNNTRVFPARLYGRRSGVKAQPLSAKNPATRDFLRGRIEVLLTRQVSSEPNEWECLVRPGRKIGAGEQLFFGEHDRTAGGSRGPGQFRGAPHPLRSRARFLCRGRAHRPRPLPPYIDRPDGLADRERYQTIYAREKGSVAAPTAGLHFTPEILARIKERGIETAEVTLHVGLGTFQPVREERVEDHRLHRESYSISPDAAAAINRALDAGRRVVAVGTTTVRTLEYSARESRPDTGRKRRSRHLYLSRP